MTLSRSTLRGRAGYTLSELMMTVAIIGILFAMGPPLMNGITNFFLMTNARNSVQRDARATLDTVNRFVRQASAASVVIDTPANQGPYSHVTFQLPDGRIMQFQQQGSKLMQTMTDTAGHTSTTMVSDNLEYIAFTYPRTDDPTIISVAVTMSRRIQFGHTKVLNLTIQKVRIMNP